jgi:uncharacterized protein (TIGR02186 family)
MRTVTLAAILLALSYATAAAEQAQRQEEVQSDISTREVAIQSNFTGIEILIFGSVDFGHAQTPDEGSYGVIVAVRGPRAPAVVRQKHRVAGIWVNGPGKIFTAPPGFYAVLSSRPLQAIASDETLQDLGIGFHNVDFGRHTHGKPEEEAFREAMIRLRKEEGLFQEHEDGVQFIGRSLFRATVALPVNVPVGRYTVDVYLFRDGALVSRNESTLDVNKVGFERVIYSLAFQHPFFYGLLAVVLAILAGLTGWFAFRRE